VVVDSTIATPVFTRPIELGADIVLHSATKYLNGHSDVVAGALITRDTDDFWLRIRKARNLGGAVLGPFEAWLLQRGLRTLFLRVRTAAGNAEKIANPCRLSKRTGPKGSSAPMGREKIPEAGGHADTLSCKFCFSLPKNPWQERLRTSPFVLDTNPSWPQYVPCSVN
jgi:hypothetical protein